MVRTTYTIIDLDDGPLTASYNDNFVNLEQGGVVINIELERFKEVLSVLDKLCGEALHPDGS